MKDITEQTSTTPEMEKKRDEGKGKKYPKRRPGKNKSMSAREKSYVPGNDFSFWNEYPELMSIATRYPWMHIAGTLLTGNKLKVALPNVAVQDFVPIPGVQNSPVSPINLAFRQMYLDMHRRYRGIGTYQASDIAITMLCIESALQMLVEAERIYGILNAYPVKSRIQPDGLLRALGYSAVFIQSVKENMADYRYQVNRLINLAKRLPLPNGMSFFANHVSLNAFVYKDSKDDRADLLLFRCTGFFEYKTTNDTGHVINSAGTAELVPFTRSTLNTYGLLISKIESVLNVLLYDSDILRITSDFIACYGEENMQVLVPMPENFVVVPIYSESILKKWHCSEHHVEGVTDLSYGSVKLQSGSFSTMINTNFFVYQADDTIISLPYIKPNGGVWNFDPTNSEIKCYCATGSDSNLDFNTNVHIVDTWEETPSIETACETLLWKSELIEVSGLNAYAYKVEGFCTELLLQITVYHVVNATLSGTDTYTAMDSSLNNSDVQDGLIHFDWHPYVFVIDANGTVDTIFGDTDNVSAVTRDTIDKVLDAALLSAFKVKISLKGSTNG